ncbi:predicted protein [Naegleria gruberi]|uniref:Predicted protein n=1 Tax=Naegleria gruberi TaxID=5762 RepID=D2VL88_NAEGR|nr:uncharacterized protein NAEGRDRAFT_69694 [Naegleria gruberi]EFC42270.1 predicted protein [Naegleria gruberi]|eukprot:XP_002675014.1 predicted protein [Naegleria gruberi strain NEG-M]
MTLSLVVAGVALGSGIVVLRASVRAMARAKSASAINSTTMKKTGFTLNADLLSKPIYGRNFIEGSFNPEMSKKEALDVLGFGKTVKHVTEEDVKKRHRKLMLLNHPDNGGSAYISSKINESKDYLLGRYGRD